MANGGVPSLDGNYVYQYYAGAIFTHGMGVGTTSTGPYGIGG